MKQYPNPYDPGKATKHGYHSTTTRCTWMASSIAVTWSLLMLFIPPALPPLSSMPEGYAYLARVLTLVGSLVTFIVLLVWTWGINRWLTLLVIAALTLGQAGIWVHR